MILGQTGYASGVQADRRRRDVLGARQPITHNLKWGLVSHWPLDEPAGSANRRDVHGGLHLPALGTVDQTAMLGASCATAFVSPTSATNHLQRLNSTFAVADIDFTWACWARADVSSPFVVSMRPAGATAYSYQLQLIVGSGVFFYLRPTSATAVNVGAAFTVAQGEWYFCCGWHDAVNDQRGARCNDVENSVAHATGAFNGTSDPLRIGVAGAAADNRDCAIWGLSFWKRMLSVDERNWLYNGGRGRLYPFV